ncbi:hypothetical protein BJ170DRAFT_716416 [Xylariales sp. AK1849]|nr:hypothetical protein BJ170DRAFT_716416 [Xylariales sp. AK1849]
MTATWSDFGLSFRYYALIVGCIFDRKPGWLSNAFLAAVLFYPAGAACHGIALAAVHVSGAIDMDVYGIFHLCTMAGLATRLTVGVSRTYFNDAGRNTVFIFTALLLAALISMIVELLRTNASDCVHDDYSNGAPPRGSDFSYGDTCGLVFSVEDGPYSLLRGGSSNNIYVIPAPDKLKFGTAVLLAAACSILTTITLISTVGRIFKVYLSKYCDQEEESVGEKPKATTSQARVSTADQEEFGTPWNPQVSYQTEPMASFGQWAPIIGTGLAAIGWWLESPSSESRPEILEPQRSTSWAPALAPPGHQGASTQLSERALLGLRKFPSAPDGGLQPARATLDLTYERTGRHRSKSF